MQQLLMERQSLIQQQSGKKGDLIMLEEGAYSKEMTQDEKEFSQKIASQKKKTHQNKAQIDALGSKKVLKVDPAK